MKLRIDNREHKLIELTNDNSFNFIEISTLDIGDIHICDNSNNILIIFERKTIPDLLSSIKDGRYSEQSLRLSENNLHNHNIYYLIEGHIGKYHNENLIYSTLCSISYFKGFSIYRTLNIGETFKFLLQFYRKIEKDKRLGYYNENNTNKEEIDYCSTIKTKKKDNINPDNILKILLIQIPGISDKIAFTIYDKYKKLDNLLYTINNNQNELYELKIINEKTNKSRKINKKSIENLILYLKK
jgi:ERCC4-type nuclease